MAGAVRTAGVEEARTRLAEILGAANRDGVVTIVTRRGVLYAAVVPVPDALRRAPELSELRGSAEGCFGDAADFVREMRDEWP